VATLRQEIQDGLHNDKWAIVDDLFTQGDCIFISDLPQACQRCWTPSMELATTKGCERFCIGSARTSLCQVHTPSCRTSCAPTQRASKTKQSISIPLGCCSCLMCHPQCGPTSPWISLRAFQGERQVCDPHYGGHVLVIRSFHPPRPPLYDNNGGTHFLLRHCSAPRHSPFNRQQQ
jgi:hypothetical protein